MEKRHIAFYIGSLSKGGSERVFVNLAEYFQSEGYDVTFVTQYQKENEYEYSPGIRRILSDIKEDETTKNRFVNFLRRFRKLRSIWKKVNPDIILSCIGKNNFMAVATSTGLNTKAVVSVVGEPSEEYPTRLLRYLAYLLFARADGMVVKTSDALQFFPRKLRKKAIVMKNSINPTFLREPFTGIREKTIVSVGRLDANKNQSLLIEAFSKIAMKYPEYKVLLYGEGEDRTKLEGIIRDMHLSDRIVLSGIIQDVAEKIHKAGIFVLTSNTEGMPNALIEAMALGIPCISTDCPCGGPKDLIRQKENGILIPVNDKKALQEALCYLLDNPELAIEMGRRATTIQKELNPGVINQAWKTYFETVIEKEKKSKK